MNIKIIVGDKLPQELLLTRRQKTIARNLRFQNNMSADAKLSKTEISKITQSGEF